MQRSSLYFILIVCFIVCSSLTVRVLSAEEADEIDERLQEVTNEKSLLQKRLELVNEQIKLLTAASRQKQALLRIDKQIDDAESNNDEDEIERLEDLADKTKMEFDFALAKLEIVEKRHSLVNLLADLDDPELKPLKEETLSLMKSMDKAEKLVVKLFEAYRSGPEANQDKLEHQFDKFEEEFDQTREVLAIKLELYWAREEEEEDLIEELEERLKNFGDSPARRSKTDGN